MKAQKHIAAIFTILFIGFITLDGQTRTRTEPRDTRERSTIERTKAKQTQARQSPTARVQTQARQTPTARVQTQARQTQARQSPATRVQSHNNGKQVATRQVQQQRNTTRYNETASRTANTPNRPVSISTRHNPKSDYREPFTKNHVKANKFSERRYYGGHYYHNVYPARKVKTHFHHDTYIHHYNVLYYPTYHEIFWTRNMYRDYTRWYPNYRWRYDYGYRIRTLSVFDAKYNLGEVAMVYGRVYATWHNRETDDYLLFFGGDFPNQQFTVVLPGRVARRFSWRPERYFLGEHMTVTGLITTFDGIPEIIVKDKRQVGIY